MASIVLETEAVLLSRRHSGESAWLISFLSPAHGILAAHKRISARGSNPAPDLFDLAALRLEKPAGGGSLWFVREYRILKRHTGIGGTVEGLEWACRFARLIEGHVFDESAAGVLFPSLLRALTAWEQGIRPETVYFKALFLFARGEGFPVREEWMASLSAGENRRARSVLRHATSRQEVESGQVRKLTRDLETYLTRRHEIQFPS